jgi:hypothetical protein
MGRVDKREEGVVWVDGEEERAGATEEKRYKRTRQWFKRMDD